MFVYLSLIHKNIERNVEGKYIILCNYFCTLLKKVLNLKKPYYIEFTNIMNFSSIKHAFVKSNIK